MICNVTDTYSDCKDEQGFKKLYCAKEIKKGFQGTVQKIFNIETEETVAGFPDVMELLIDSTIRAHFYEFKFSDKRGNIKFQPTQPAFYKRNPEMEICVVAYNCVSRRVHLFRTNEISDKESPYYTTNARINLNEVERQVGV
jgi:hypothetical protein